MRAAVKRVGSVLVVAALFFGLFAAPASAITPKSLEWPVAKQAIAPAAAFGYIAPRPRGLSPYAIYPYFARTAVTLKTTQYGPVVAAEEGTVVFVGTTGTQYNAAPLVVIQHIDDVDGSAFTTQYVAVTPSVALGDVVQEGAQVGVTTDPFGIFYFSVRTGAYNPAAWGAQTYYGMYTLPSNPKYYPAMWHFPSQFVNPAPLFE